MNKFTNDSTILSHQHAVDAARLIEQEATNDHLNGLVSEAVVLGYMMETEAAVEAGIAAGASFRDL